MNLFKKSSSAIAEIDNEEEAASQAPIEPVEGQLSLDDLDGAPTASEDEIDDQLALDVGLPEAKPAETEEQAEEPDEESGGSVATKKAVKTAKAPAARRVSAAKATAAARSVSGPPIWVMVVLGVVVAALLGGAFFLRSETEGKYSEKELDSASRAAVNAAQDISSWDYRTIESDTKNVLKETTGDFRAAYEKSAAKLLAQAPAQEAIVLGTASKAGVESADKDGVRVLVFLNQSTNRKGAEPSTDLHRLRLTMTKVDGSWLVSKLEVL